MTSKYRTDSEPTSARSVNGDSIGFDHSYMTALRKNNCRWYQFSLKSFLIFISLLSVGFGGWAYRSKEWIRQRHEAFATRLVIDLSDSPANSRRDRPRAPGGLWLFGERGFSELMVRLRHDMNENQNDRENAAALFPEADLGRY